MLVILVRQKDETKAKRRLVKNRYYRYSRQGYSLVFGTIPSSLRRRESDRRGVYGFSVYFLCGRGGRDPSAVRHSPVRCKLVLCAFQVE